MDVQLSTRLARLGSRLATTGLKHRELTRRIVELQQRAQNEDVAVQRLERERRRLDAEIAQYEAMLFAIAERKSA